MARVDRVIAVGVDIGGTSTRVGIVDESGRILAGHRFPTQQHSEARTLIAKTVQAISALRRRIPENLTSTAPGLPIGLSLCGLIDRCGGVVTRSIHLPWLEHQAILTWLVNSGHASGELMTDAEAATWGEYVRHPSAPTRFVHLRLGTGVACGVVVDAQLVDLVEDRTTHLDELVVDAGTNAPHCRCGRRGCLDAIAGGAALLDRVRAEGLGASLDDLERAWRRGDRRALAIIERSAEAIAKAIDKLAEAYRPDILSIGGGAITHVPCLMASVTASKCQSTGTKTGCDSAMWERARLGDGAGVIGAALRAADSA